MVSVLLSSASVGSGPTGSEESEEGLEHHFVWWVVLGCGCAVKGELMSERVIGNVCDSPTSELGFIPLLMTVIQPRSFLRSHIRGLLSSH